MPSVSEKQKKYFAWLAHDPKAAKEQGVDIDVARDFHEADKKKDAEDKKKSEAKKKD